MSMKNFQRKTKKRKKTTKKTTKKTSKKTSQSFKLNVTRPLKDDIVRNQIT